MGNQGGNLSWSQPSTSSTASYGDSEEQLSGDTLAVDKPIDSAAKELQELTVKINKAIKLRSKTPNRIWFEGKVHKYEACMYIIGSVKERAVCHLIDA